MSTHSEIGYKTKNNGKYISTYWNGTPSDTLPILKFFLAYFGFAAFKKDIDKHYTQEGSAAGVPGISICLNSLRNKSLASEKAWAQGGSGEGGEHVYTVSPTTISFNDWLHPGEDNEKEVDRTIKYTVPQFKNLLNHKILKSVFMKNWTKEDESPEEARLVYE